MNPWGDGQNLLLEGPSWHHLAANACYAMLRSSQKRAKSGRKSSPDEEMGGSAQGLLARAIIGRHCSEKTPHYARAKSMELI
eukprot:5588707-Amphidinium_carterae.1